MRNRTKASLCAVGLSCLGAIGSLFTYSVHAREHERDGDRDREAKRHSEHRERRKGMDKIKHIVFLIKENRTFDNYFGTYPGANGATTAVDSEGETIPLQHEKDSIPDIEHAPQGARMAYDNGKMDQFDLLNNETTTYPMRQANPYANNSLTQLYQSDIPNYWLYAQNFVLGDNMFSSLMGPTFPNHLYTIAAQSGGVINNPVTDKNVGTLRNAAKGWGCDVPNQQVP